MLTAMTMTASILKLRIGSFVALAALVGVLTAGGGMGWAEVLVFTTCRPRRIRGGGGVQPLLRAGHRPADGADLQPALRQQDP